MSFRLPWNSELARQVCAQAVLTPEDDEENFSMLEAFHLAQEIDSTLSLKQPFKDMAIVVDVHEVWCHRIPNEHIIVPYLQPTDVDYTFGAILSVNVVFEPYKKRYIAARFTCDYLMSHIYEPDGTILYLADLRTIKNRRGYFTNDVLGIVHDPKERLQKVIDKRPKAPAYTCWVRYKFDHDPKTKFVVERAAYVPTLEELYGKDEEEQ